ncbi:hypothetical protein SUGI_0531340 [Cryptomeria japonica]|nr:hypothetical protein SUGI_0531340 [Cryptomeria japonica]
MEVFSGSLRKVAAIMIVVVMVGVRVEGEDPDLLTDFDLSSGATIDGNFFTFKGFNGVGSNSTASGSFKITRATQQEFPGLMGLGTVLLPSTLFGSGIADLVLQKSFMISPETLSMLKAPFL